MSDVAVPRDATPEKSDTQGMDYLVSLPRRVVTIYVPLGRIPVRAAVPVLLDGRHHVQAEQGADLPRRQSVLGQEPDARAHQEAAVRHGYPEWLWNTMLVAGRRDVPVARRSVFAAYAIERLRFRGARYVGMSIFLAYLVPPSILFIPLATIVFKLGLFDTRLALILTYPTFLIPFCTWLLMGYFRSIPTSSRNAR